MWLACLLAFLVFLVILVVKTRSKKLLDLHRQIKVDFPYIPLIGHAYKFIGSNEDRMTMFGELARQAYTNKHGLASFWLENYLVVSISDPATASIVLKNFSDKWPVTLMMRHLLGNGSVFGEEEIWRLRRKILVPVFNSKYCNNFAKVFERNNKIMIERLAAVVDKGEFSMWEYFSTYTLDSAFDMTFGENLNVQKNPDHPFAIAFQDYFKNCAARLCQPWLYSTTLYELLPVGARQERNKRLIWDCVEDLIKKKKTVSKEQNENRIEHNTKNTHNEQFKSFLDLLIEFSGGEDGYTDTELREESLVLLLAAPDTSATALCFAAVLLANHPEVQDRVYQEIQEILGDSEKSLANLAKLKYLDAVVKETLRLYPPAPVTVRRCSRDLQLPEFSATAQSTTIYLLYTFSADTNSIPSRLLLTSPKLFTADSSGLVLNEGCFFLLNFWGIHRNPHCWGPDADQFRPERFLRATPEQLAAFMPFGHGPRNCTGLHLALTSIKLSLVELMRRYRVAPATSYAYSPHQPLRVSFNFTLKHVHEYKVQLENRH